MICPGEAIILRSRRGCSLLKSLIIYNRRSSKNLLTSYQNHCWLLDSGLKRYFILVYTCSLMLFFITNLLNGKPGYKRKSHKRTLFFYCMGRLREGGGLSENLYFFYWMGKLRKGGELSDNWNKDLFWKVVFALQLRQDSILRNRILFKLLHMLTSSLRNDNFFFLIFSNVYTYPTV